MDAAKGGRTLSSKSARTPNGNLGFPGGDHAQPGDDGAIVPTWEGLKICSDLDFNGLSWSNNVQTTERDPFALALNISGSYEGSNGWANLSNNFDGQGLSMGLLNQNLGQGTLQPLIAEMRTQDAAGLAAIFTASNLKSLLKMVEKWESQTRVAAIRIHDYGYSELDEPAIVAAEMGIDPLELEEVTTALVSRNQEAVTWAKITLYVKSLFKNDWSKQLRALASSASYRSIQVRRAEVLHTKALELMNLYGFESLRSYLFFFDVVVQNGGISNSVRDRYIAWAKLSANQTATEKAKLIKLLELRLTAVKKIYVTDVRTRKLAIINGVGTVHGSKRDFAKEFCTDLNQSI